MLNNLRYDPPATKYSGAYPRVRVTSRPVSVAFLGRTELAEDLRNIASQSVASRRGVGNDERQTNERTDWDGSSKRFTPNVRSNVPSVPTISPPHAEPRFRFILHETRLSLVRANP